MFQLSTTFKIIGTVFRIEKLSCFSSTIGFTNGVRDVKGEKDYLDRGT